MTIFQTVTQEGWSQLMEMYSDAYPRILTSAFFVTCIIVCSVFLLNLSIAVLLENYSELDSSVGFMFTSNQSLWEVGEKHNLPPEIIDEIVEMNTGKISVKLQRWMEILNEYGVDEKQFKHTTMCQELFYAFIWDKDVIREGKKIWNKQWRFLYFIFMSPIFNTFIILLVVVNTVFLAMDRYPEPSAYE